VFFAVGYWLLDVGLLVFRLIALRAKRQQPTANFFNILVL